MESNLVRVVHANGSTQISWRSRRLLIDRGLTIFLFVFAVVWAAFSLFLTYQKLVVEENTAILLTLTGCIAFSIPSLLIPLLWFSGRGLESVEISEDFYVHSHSHSFVLGNKKWNVADIDSVEIGYYRDRIPSWLPGSFESETVISLNVLPKSFFGRDLLAFWMHEDVKRVIFDHIRDAAIRYKLSWEFCDSTRRDNR